MSDAYRTPALVCPSCASPMREFQKRLVCDACQGILMALEDFRSACADMVGREIDVEAHDLVPSEAMCPRCQGTLAACKLRVGGNKIRGAFETCERDGLWFGRDALPAVFAAVNRKFVGYTGGYKQGDHTRRVFQPRSGGDASDGLSIAAWRSRPRKRAKTLTPVNAYADRTLRCPACSARDLAFLGDRWACEQCHGVFVQTAAVEALVMEMIDAPWSMPSPAGAAGARACPVCVAAMTIETLDGVSLDRCAEHGVWFDPTELEAVLVREGDRPSGLVGWLRRLFR